jgi:uncharacterized protein (TIGR02594 family)
MMYDTRAIQARLNHLGFGPLVVDGAIGPRTRAAIIRFQTGSGLTPDGIVGPATRAAMFGAGARKPRPAENVPTELPWLVEAQRLRGLREVKGAGDSPVIMDWAEDLGIPYANDETPWCGLFVAHCIRTGLPYADLPANPLGARAWQGFGSGMRPMLGAVMVFWRGSRDGWQGHVGFYWAEDDAAYHVLGGNQSDSVSVTRIAKDRLLEARWPSGVPISGITRTATAGGSLLSTNEA